MSSYPAAPVADAGPATGIVWTYRFNADGSAEPIPPEGVNAALAEFGGGWIWVHLALADNRCRNWIAQHAPVSGLARDVLAGQDRYPRMDILGHEIVGVLPDLHQELAKPGDDLVRLRFVLTEHLLITARQQPVHSIDVNRRAIEAGKRFPTAISFLDAVIDQFADAVGRMAEEHSQELDSIEDRLLHEEPSDERSRIGRVRAKAVHMHRQLIQLKGMFHRIEPRMSAEHAKLAQAIHALTQKLDGIDHDVHSLQERARLLLDEVAAKMTEITNRRLFTLSILTACLLPPTLVTGFFGMNTKDMVFQNTDGGTFWAMGVMAASAVVSYWALRRMRAF